MSACELNDGISLIVTNLNMGFEAIVLIIMISSGLIWFARGWKDGLLYMFIMFAALFVGMYQMGCNYTKFLLLDLVALVLMCITIYISSKTKNEGLPAI